MYYWFSTKQAVVIAHDQLEWMLPAILDKPDFDPISHDTPGILPDTFSYLPGYFKAIDLESGQLFKYTVSSSDSSDKPNWDDAVLIGAFDDNNVVKLHGPQGLPFGYYIGDGEAKEGILTLEQAARLQEICDRQHVEMPLVKGFVPRTRATSRRGLALLRNGCIDPGI